VTKDEYRKAMRTYSRDTMVMSFVVTKHPDYRAMREAGAEIIPYLFADMVDPAWHCSHCYGEGFEFPADWVWDNVKRNWPEDTGIPCTQCNGKGNVNSWACMMLLAEAMGDTRPEIPRKFQGKHDAIVKIYLKWGEQHGYLPPTPDPEPSALKKIGLAIFSIVKLWGS
jgi:hypothetical protein